jgi:hypothetical protein
LSSLCTNQDITYNDTKLNFWWMEVIFLSPVVSFIVGGNREYPEKATDLSQVTDKLYHIMLCRVHFCWVGFELTTLVVIDTDYICSTINFCRMSQDVGKIRFHCTYLFISIFILNAIVLYFINHFFTMGIRWNVGK